MDLRLRLAVALALALVCGSASAAPKRSFVVELTGTPWRAEAMTAALAADLSDDQLAYHTPVSGPDAVLRAAGVELVVHAELLETMLHYELRALWPGAPAPIRGAIALGSVDRAGLAGILRDKLHRFARLTSDAEASAAIDMPNVADVLLAIVLAASLLLAPFVIGLLRLGAKVLALPALRRTASAIATVGGIAIVVAAVGGTVRNPTGILLGVGGLTWGSFVSVTMPIVFPPLVGLSRIEHDELPRVLRSWGALAMQRSFAMLALYGPIGLATWVAGRSMLDNTVLIALIIPLVLLVVRFAVRSTVAVLALSLDAQLTDSSADTAAWDAATRAYLIGYCRRNGLPVDHELLSRIALLAGIGEDIAVYGGGATHSRIVIPRRMLELALAPWGRPHDYAAPRVSTLHWQQWNAGLVMATEPGAVVATREQRQPRETTVEGDTEREAIGEPPTLAGIIEPRALDPRTAYRPLEDPMFLDWEGGEEYDGTDAGDRDFLFGALVLALGRIQRHADRWSTLSLIAKRYRLTRKLEPITRVLERVPAAVGDDHAALGGARHHLLQYIGWQIAHREDLLTARAYAPELEQASQRVLQTLGPQAGHAQLRRRLVRLGTPIRGAPPAPVVRWQRLVYASVLVAGASVVVLAIVDAVRYHATYTDRMSNTERADHGKAK